MVVKTHSILIDTREQHPWNFEDFSTITCKLDTGDYSLEGLENKLCIERKGCITEFASNLLDERFERELDRMSKYKYRYILLEFSLEDLINYPLSIKNPKIQEKIKVTGRFLLRKMLELQIKYDFHVYFVESLGRDMAISIFKRILDVEN